jgi:hypothetical protein
VPNGDHHGYDERRRAWLQLEMRERELRHGHLAPGSQRPGQSQYNSLGAQQADWSLTSRVHRVRAALDESRPLAWQRIAHTFAVIDIAAVWPILSNLASDIALYAGAGAVTGALLGGVAGFFLGGLGAGAGAWAGASVGTGAGLALLNWIGLAGLARDLAHIVPRALEHYIDGFRTAWGPEPEPRTGYAGFRIPDHAGASDFHLPHQAAIKISQGHVALVTALLLAIMAWVTRGRGDRLAVLAEIRSSRRLGPRVADWVEANEAKFGAQMASMEARARGGRVGGRGAQSAASNAPAGARPIAKSAEPPPERAKSNKEKALTGEAAGRDYMQRNGFEKISGDKAWNKWGVDDIWKNAHPPPDYVVTEYKYGSSSLGSTKDGLQMSDDWLKGINTGRERIAEAVGRNEALRVEDALDAGGVEKWLLRVDDRGGVSKDVLDALGKVSKGP